MRSLLRSLRKKRQSLKNVLVSNELTRRIAPVRVLFWGPHHFFDPILPIEQF